MPTFQRCPNAINEMADEILKSYDSHKSLLDAGVNIDFVFAFADRDDNGNILNQALTLHGNRALGIAKKIALKERAMGRGDCEVSLDHDHWEGIPEDQQRALLDHELHHFQVKIDKRGLVRDDLGRPMIQIRHHDFDVGFFKVIAERHGAASPERIAAKAMADTAGQYFWPEVFGSPKQLTDDTTVTISGAGESVSMTGKQFSEAAGKLRKLKK